MTVTIDCHLHEEQPLIHVGGGRWLCEACADEEGKSRLCLCGCGEPLPRSRKLTAKYVDHRHAQRAYRKRLKERAEAQGVPSSLTFKELDSTNPLGNRHGDGESSARAARATSKKPRKPSLRISYRKAVDALAEYLAEHDYGNEPAGLKKTFADADAKTILRPLLTDAQKAAL